MKQVIRRISKTRVNGYLRKANARLNQEQKLELKIAKEKSELEALREKGSPSLVIRVHENILMRLNSELLNARAKRLEAERFFGKSVAHNNKLNGGEQSSSLVLA